jgi:hypothetical protein
MLPPDLFAKSLAVLAFITAFYALAARERKTPYITNSLYSTLYLFLLSMLFSIGASYLPQDYPQITKALSVASSATFAVAVFVVAYRLWQLQNRHVHFRDNNLVGNTKIVRNLRSVWRSIRRKPTYEHSPVPFTPDLTASIAEHPFFNANSFKGDRGFSSVFLRVDSLRVADTSLVDLAFRFLACGCQVQYTTCLRHPYEFASSLKRYIEGRPSKTGNTTWQEAAQRLVLVDAYTPHFGFADSVHVEVTKKLREMGVRQIITSAPTYAGVHTAAAKAFNAVKKAQKDLPRRPTLVIYEGTYALADLESIEQYRIFVRHVIPSERLWGGMLTLFLETQISAETEALVKSYADVAISALPEESVS